MPFLFTVSWGALSGWWALLCLVAGLGYAWLLYRQPIGLSANWRAGLFALRAIVVTVIALLLIAPLVQSVTYQPERPLVLVLQDNSQSVAAKTQQQSAQVAAALQQLQTQLGRGYDVRPYHFDGQLHAGPTATFNGTRTNIGQALRQAGQQYVNQNIGAVILATDGLYNTGTDPQYEARNIKSNIYTIALGDTTIQRDALIGNVNYNKTAFLGNDFMVDVLAQAYRAPGEPLQLRITEGGRTVYSKNITISGNSYRQTLPVKLNAASKGLHKYTISIVPLVAEVNTQNNNEVIYVDVIDDRQNILLVYDAMHPDVGVLKSAIESNSKYEVSTVALTDLQSSALANINLLICFQLTEGASPILQNFVAKNHVPVWYTLGAQSSMNNLQGAGAVITYAGNPATVQEGFAQPVAGFAAFTVADSTLAKMAQMPPLQIPFGNYTLAGGASALFTQRIGNVRTSYPLLAFAATADKRTAVLAGEGLWHWRLAEFAQYGSHQAINDLATQCVQYLTVNAQRKQFDVFASRSVFDEGDEVLLNAELYNDALELINTPDVSIKIKSQAGRVFDFLFSRTGASYQLNTGALPPGEYSYTAGTTLGNKKYAATGAFTIRQINAEARQTTANHRLLRDIALQSGGKMLLPQQINQLAGIIKANADARTVVHEDKIYRELIDVKWVFFVLLGLLSAEWLLRKREGEV